MDTIDDLYATLQRYAGRLGTDHLASVVKSDVKHLGAALATGIDRRGLLDNLHSNMVRLPDFELRDPLLATVSQLRQKLRR